MQYDWKPWEEAGWFVVTAAGTVVLQALATTDLSTVTDLKAWTIGVGAAAVRAAAGAALAWLGGKR